MIECKQILALAPLAPEAEWAGQRKVYELDHMEPIGKGGIFMT